VTGTHRDKVAGYVETGLNEVEGHENGFFLGPCLFDRVTPGMSVYTDDGWR
jgi:malonate-semialdehyde dehydrogenase (acetylating)/methylmalonate-semialdehyde dehydrogenase